jgi:hypothetical protein
MNLETYPVFSFCFLVSAFVKEQTGNVDENKGRGQEVEKSRVE